MVSTDEHPVIGEELGQVVSHAVRKNDNDALIGGKSLGNLKIYFDPKIHDRF